MSAKAGFCRLKQQNEPLEIRMVYHPGFLKHKMQDA
jgi:hypothetical protein